MTEPYPPEDNTLPEPESDWLNDVVTSVRARCVHGILPANILIGKESYNSRGTPEIGDYGTDTKLFIDSWDEEMGGRPDSDTSKFFMSLRRYYESMTMSWDPKSHFIALLPVPRGKNYPENHSIFVYAFPADVSKVDQRGDQVTFVGVLIPTELGQKQIEKIRGDPQTLESFYVSAFPEFDYRSSESGLRRRGTTSLKILDSDILSTLTHFNAGKKINDLPGYDFRIQNISN